MPPTSAGTPVVRERPNYDWENWHSTVRSRVNRLVDIWNPNSNQSSVAGYNATTACLQRYIAQAVQQGLHLRALGGNWSFSPAAKTDGILINTQNLNYWFEVPPQRVDPAYRGRQADLLFVQCGNAIGVLNGILEPRGRCLRTSGASNGQTIAGALSTGTHGAAIDVGAVQDYVVALHILTAPDRQVWLERASYPVADPSLPRLFNASLIRDDALFNAALVSFGSFGIIHGVVIETSPRYYLQVFRQQWPKSEGLRRLADSLDFTAVPLPRGAGVRPFHLGMVFNPHDPDGGAFVTLMYREENLPAGAKRIAGQGSLAPGDDAGSMMGHLVDLFPDLTPALVKTGVKLVFHAADGEYGTPGEVFRKTTTRGKLSSSAMGIPLGRVREALDLLLELNQRTTFPGFFAVRYVRSSMATLAFTHHEPQTCVLELDSPVSGHTDKFLEAAWRALDERGIPLTFHWGKRQPLDPQLLRKVYGQRRIEAWLGARSRLLQGPGMKNVFSNPMLTSLRLDEDFSAAASPAIV